MKFKSDEIVPVGRKGIYEINTGGWRKLRPIVNKDKCIKCGMCYLFCPVFAIVKDDEGYFVPTTGYCKGCGVCAHECPKEAIDMIKETGGQDGQD